MQSISVVLPAPFGPMMQRSSPRSSVIVRSVRALKPSNWTLMLSTHRWARGRPGWTSGRPPAAGSEPTSARAGPARSLSSTCDVSIGEGSDWGALLALRDIAADLRWVPGGSFRGRGGAALRELALEPGEVRVVERAGEAAREEQGDAHEQRAQHVEPQVGR